MVNSTVNKAPIYNMKVVLQKTNLKADVLRAWERRFDLPSPHRTPGGHRLYSDYDIEVVKWLQARQAEGLSISRAVEVWKAAASQGRDPLNDETFLAIPQNRNQLIGDIQTDVFRQNWIEACLAFNSIEGENILNQAFAIYSAETVCFDILQKGIHEIGSLWYQNKATVQQEHFATELATRRIETLINGTPNPTRPQTIMTGCPGGEWHSFPLLILTLMLRRKGFNVIYLGSNIPLDQIEQTASAIRPTLIILAAQQLSTAAELSSVGQLFRKVNTPMAFGGLIFNRLPDLRERIPGFFLGESLDLAIDSVERLINAPVVLPPIIEVDKKFIETAAAYLGKLPFVEVELIDQLKVRGFPSEYLQDVNSLFAKGLSSALRLGNLKFLESDLEWVKKLLADRNIPPIMLYPYLAEYRQAILTVMPEDGSFIAGWIADYLKNNNSNDKNNKNNKTREGFDSSEIGG